MAQLAELLGRGLFLKCPVCGQGNLFHGPFRMNKRCPVCNFYFEREEGYFTSSMAINLIISELIVTCIAVPLAANPHIPLLTTLLICSPLPLVLPLLFFHHSRGMWISIDHYLNPPRGQGIAPPHQPLIDEM